MFWCQTKRDPQSILKYSTNIWYDYNVWLFAGIECFNRPNMTIKWNKIIWHSRFFASKVPTRELPTILWSIVSMYVNGYFKFLRAPNKAYFERHKKGLFSHCWRTIYLFNLWGSVTNCGHICVDGSVVWCIVMGPFCAVFYWTSSSLIRHGEVNAHY